MLDFAADPDDDTSHPGPQRRPYVPREAWLYQETIAYLILGLVLVRSILEAVGIFQSESWQSRE